MTAFSRHPTPRLTLVGAGPGDADLLTIRAIRTLESADVVLYDALVSPDVLAYIPPHVPALPVGKRAGKHSHTQAEINELIVDLARHYGHVVRLKGGDPFVFGRATEELDAAARHGIPASVVPGISSALAAPTGLGIPVTARGVSESFWVITGTTQDGRISTDVALAAQSTATVVVLMGLGQLAGIAAIFAAHGRADLPVAVIQNATLPNQRYVLGTVDTIASDVAQARIAAPAVIVLGETVRYAAVADVLAPLHVVENVALAAASPE